ncbi:LCP family protein [Actinomadura formosensis]|uniref:LCP family protein n=1 Tax=Actinomadura formosensis TaxID=60706 RepID=UPI003D9506BD
MDDLDLIRDLGRDLEHEPPASFARQRSRLLDAARRRRRGPGRWALLGVVAAVTAAAILVPVTILQGRHARPVATNSAEPVAGRAMNVLVIGVDRRVAARPPRSDTLMLVHVPADRRDLRAVSVPRDSLVRIPACTTGGGKTVPAQLGMINAAFSLGGADCTVRTLESLTGVRIDQTVMIDFDGFRKAVDALGGVRMTLRHPVVDPAAGLRLPQGEQRLNGAQALAYVRARRALGDGSDLGRIKRQQQFMAALVREAKEQMGGNPVRFAKFLMVVTGSFETAPRLDAGRLQALARAFGKGGSVEFSTVPVHPARSDPNRLEWDRAGAARLFATFKTS